MYLLDFLDGQRSIADDGEDVLVVPGDLLAEQGPLTYHDSNLWWFLRFFHDDVEIVFILKLYLCYLFLTLLSILAKN